MSADDDFSVEVYKSIIERVGQVIRYCFAMNAGAIVALLAFLGQIWGQRADIDPARINAVVLWFVVGLVAAVLAGVVDYVTLSRLYQEQAGRAKKGVNERFAWLSLAFLALSVGFFGVGAWSSSLILAEGVTWDSRATWDSGLVWPP
jgi:hypothetical protein